VVVKTELQAQQITGVARVERQVALELLERQAVTVRVQAVEEIQVVPQQQVAQVVMEFRVEVVVTVMVQAYQMVEQAVTEVLLEEEAVLLLQLELVA